MMSGTNISLILFLEMRFFRNIIVVLLCIFFVQTAQAEWKRKKLTVLSWLHSVQFINEQKGWIVGSKGTFLYTLDSGTTWRKKKNFTEDTIRDVHFFDENNGWILCDRNVYSLGNQAPSYLQKTSNGGETWEKVDFTEGTGRERISRFFFDSGKRGFAIGEAGSIFSNTGDLNVWKKQSSPSRYLLLGGTFNDDANACLIGAGGTVFFTQDAGETWKTPTISGNTQNRFNSIFFTDKKNGWIVGSEGKILNSTNGGKLWREQKSNVTNDLKDIAFFDSSNGFAIGDDGMILKTQNGGNVWRPTPLESKHKFERIFLTSKSGWIVGFGGVVYQYSK
jgi:photosystem II stability/assembly factor-like uncharacterized protein